MQSKAKVIDRDLLEEYVSKPIFERLKAYAKANTLSFKVKDEFISILDYYKLNFAQ